jgi:hypothetical protein
MSVHVMVPPVVLPDGALLVGVVYAENAGIALNLATIADLVWLPVDPAMKVSFPARTAKFLNV